MIEDKIIEELKAENEKLISNVNLHFAKNFVLQDENTRLKEEKTILNHKLSIQLERNTQLKIQLDDENRLKQELFNLYLKHYN